ncbi:hypothetical protein BASA81_001382 [Batrachochytrium salamandrivorans]|nr:hypothetical protein BASA81_001382 [Batrachochytrium salamandrivorans]
MPEDNSGKPPRRSSSFISQFASSVLASLSAPSKRRNTVFGARKPASSGGMFSKRQMPRRRQSSMSTPAMLLIKSAECCCTSSSVPVQPSSPRSMQVKRRTLASGRVLEKTLRKDTALRRQLELYAATRYETENVAFLEQVLAWKQTGDAVEAERICNTFIREGAELQVNISHGARVETLGGGGGGGPLARFDRAVNEVSIMMVNGGIFHSFVFAGKLDGFEDRMSNGATVV